MSKINAVTISAVTISGTITAAGEMSGTVQIAGEPVLDSVTVKSTGVSQTITPEQGTDGFNEITVSPLLLQSKSVTPTATAQIITADSGYDALSSVEVGAGEDRLPGLWFGTSGQNLTVYAQGANKIFSGNKWAQRLVLPDATEIDQYACYSWPGLLSVDAPNVTEIGLYAFSNSTLTSFNLPSLQVIGQKGFNYCSNLGTTYPTLELPNVTDIGDNAFSNCGLRNVVLPNVQNIGSNAFGSNYSMQTLTISRDDGVCTLGNTGALPSSIQHIYVPAALVDSYKEATNWATFSAKISAIGG